MDTLTTWRLSKGKVFAACISHSRRVYRQKQDALLRMRTGYTCDWPGCESRAVVEYWPRGIKHVHTILRYLKYEPIAPLDEHTLDATCGVDGNGPRPLIPLVKLVPPTFEQMELLSKMMRALMARERGSQPVVPGYV